MSTVNIPMTAQGALSEIRYRESLFASYQARDNGPDDQDSTVGALKFGEDSVHLTGSPEAGQLTEDTRSKRRQDITRFDGVAVDVELFEKKANGGFWRQRMHLDRAHPGLSTCTVEETSPH